MEEIMKIDLIAHMKNYEDFIAEYKDGDAKRKFDGKNLLFFSLSNTNLTERYRISNFLIEANIDSRGTNREGQNVFHVLLGQADNTIPEVVKMCKFFIDQGVDINQKDKNGQMPIQYIIRMNNTDEDLKDLYDLWFSQENLDFVSKDITGCTAIEYAKKFPYRKKLVKRMEEYVK